MLWGRYPFDFVATNRTPGENDALQLLEAPTPRDRLRRDHLTADNEAQRAWDVEQVAAKHALPIHVSEPEAFVGFGERMPGWCGLVELIGSGHEIHVGEEAGLGLWRTPAAAWWRSGGTGDRLGPEYAARVRRIPGI